ncbi:F-box-like domain-containing protein [Pelagibaculum spongiae]|uniref:F-box domain-containing protein n=1 Tax=Pelagibaculum spongiae TaxID=2080658 RepID=A0A2V1H288_9GAMM|nr:F-box-like domain-containing protein [Pelagibaculum spongiae]PVZ69790.1 hypothetical protein DC094_10905 [Pelagibaculum spongiae]
MDKDPESRQSEFSHFDTLPQEMLFEIFSYLDFQSLARLTQTSIGFRNIVLCPSFQRQYLSRDFAHRTPWHLNYDIVISRSEAEVFFQTLRSPALLIRQFTPLRQSLRCDSGLHSPAFSVIKRLPFTNYPARDSEIGSIAISRSNQWLAAIFSLPNDRHTLWVFNFDNHLSWRLGTISVHSKKFSDFGNLTFSGDRLYSLRENRFSGWRLDPHAGPKKLNPRSINQKNVEMLIFDEARHTGVSYNIIPSLSCFNIPQSHYLQQLSITHIQGQVVDHPLKAYTLGMMYYTQRPPGINPTGTKLIYRDCAAVNKKIQKNFSKKILSAMVHPNEESIFILCDKLHRWSPLTSTTTTFDYTTPPHLRPRLPFESTLFFSNNKQEIYLVRIDGSLVRFDLKTNRHDIYPNFKLAGNPPYHEITISSDNYLTYTSTAGLMSQKIGPEEQAYPFPDSGDSDGDSFKPRISRYIVSPCGKLLILITPKGISVCNAAPIRSIVFSSFL